MTQQQVNVGAAANDGTGDALRTAFQTVNANALDALSKGDTSAQSIASDFNFASGKGVQFDGGEAFIVTRGYHTATLTPELGGSIDVNTSDDQIRYRKSGSHVSVHGMIRVGTPSTPTGDYVAMSLPFAIANLDDSAGRFGGAIQYNVSAGARSLEPFLALEGSSEIRIYKDAGTWGSSDVIYFNFSYETV